MAIPGPSSECGYPSSPTLSSFWYPQPSCCLGIPRKLQLSLIILYVTAARVCNYCQGCPGLPAGGTNATWLPNPCSPLETTLSHSSHSVNLFRKCHSARKRVKPEGEWIGVTGVSLPVYPARFLSRSPTHSEQAAWPPCPDCPPGLPVSCLPGGDLRIPISLFQIKRCFKIKGCWQPGSLS